ncbi:MAG: M48 family metallopeptidase, partial [Ignavibacteriae bacterium]|nr:M48 family metallopeptidase [Ignavibacteriota bacterium]
DYVIIHELCHLKEMNHSAKFWKLVNSIVPEYNVYRKELNKIIL